MKLRLNLEFFVYLILVGLLLGALALVSAGSQFNITQLVYRGF